MNPLSTSPRTALLSVAFFCVSNFSAQALTLQEAYALKGSGQVAAELSLSASGAPQGDATVSALAQPGQGGRLLADLNRLGLTHGAQAGRLVTGRLPLSAVPKLAGLASLHSIRPSHALFLAADPGAGRQGSIVSQGDTEMYAAAARTRFQVDGTGVKVGVLSDSFNCQRSLGENADGSIRFGPARTPPLVEIGELPEVQVLADIGPCEWLMDHPSAQNEGSKILSVIHDLAPGASLAFHTAALGAVDMAQGIRALADAGASVIVDDTIYLEEPVYQDGGPIADAVKDVVARGVSYVSAAGNFGRKTYEAPFQHSGVTITIPAQVSEWTTYSSSGGKDNRVTSPARSVELHDFDPGPGVSTCQRVALPGNAVKAISLHWDQPYASIGGGLGATSDLDLFLMDESCKQVYTVNPIYVPIGFSVANLPPGIGLIGVAATNNIGGDAVETLTMPRYGMADYRTFGIAIGLAAGAAPGRFSITYTGQPYTFNIFRGNDPSNGDSTVYTGLLPAQTAEYTQSGPTIFGHANLPETITVGAVGKRGDISPNQSGLLGTEPFSALGGTALLFDDHGQPLAQPIQRRKPDVSGLDGVFDSYFYGTSAAAAHVGGLLALARQAAPAATPGQIAEALRATAIDLDDTLTPGTDTGFDFATGHGLADGENLIAKLLTQPNTAHAGANTPGIVDCAQPTATLKSGAKYRGTPGGDVAKGAAGKETLNGLQGDDSLCGEAGNDQLLGGPGDDLLVGGTGNDVLIGGPGNDVFRFGVGAGADKIMDFTRGDKIVFVGKADNNGDGTIDFTLEDKPTGTLLRFPNGDTLMLRNVRSKRLAHLPITGSTYTLVFQN